MKNEYRKKKLFIHMSGSPTGLLRDLKDSMLAPEVKLLFDINYQTSSDILFTDPRGNPISAKDKELHLFNTIMENDVFVYDLNSCDLVELRLALRLLKNTKLPGDKKLIMVSNLLTWEDTVHRAPTSEEQEASILSDYDTVVDMDKEDQPEETQEEEMPESEDEEAQPDEQDGDEENEPVPEMATYSEKDYLLRRANGAYRKFIEIENLAIDLAKSVPQLTVYVVCPGIVYGQQSSPLYEVLKQAWLQEPSELQYINSIDLIATTGHVPVKENNEVAGKEEEITEANDENVGDNVEPVPLEELPIGEYNKRLKFMRLARGKNNLPLIHISDLLQYIKFLVLEAYQLPTYIIARDQAKNSRQLDILRAISKGIGSNKIASTDQQSCLYSAELKRLLTMDISLSPTNVFLKHKRKLKEFKEAKEAEEQAEQNEAEEENSDQEDEEITAKEPKMALIPPLEYGLSFKRGIVANVKSLKEEFCSQSGLRSNKILVIGSSFSGKSTLAKQLARYFKIPYLNINNIVADILTRNDELASEVQAYVDERKEENRTQEEELKEKRKKQKKYGQQPSQAAKPLISGELAVKCLKTRLRDNICINRGYVLDDIFDDYKTLAEIYKSKLIS